MPRRSATAILVLISILGLGGASSTPVAAVDPGGGASRAPAASRALEFRKMFGLNADPAMIARAASDRSYSATNYGVPLSRSEELELQRRARAELDTQAAATYAQAQLTYGGYYIDQVAHGIPVFLFTANDKSISAELAKRLPHGSGFRVQRVERTYADLLAIKERIEASADDLIAAGIEINSIGLHVSTNTVAVGVYRLTSGATSQLIGRFGDGLEVFEQSPANSDSCSTNNCRPMKGGLSIFSVANGNECTSGFMVRRVQNGGQLAILTAGHCVHNDALNATWKHNGIVFGNRKFDTWTNHSDGDVSLIELKESEVVPVANQLYVFDGSAGFVKTVTTWISNLSQTQGSQVCAYGTNSNNSACVTILHVDETHSSKLGNTSIWIDHTNTFGLDMIPGDSGGPIYKVLSDTARGAMGTHVHSTDGVGAFSWYTPFEWGRTAYTAASGGDYYYMCTTASC
jgi:Trypsin